MPSPQQISDKVFPVVRRGYDPAAVDEFLAAVAAEHHRVLARRAEEERPMTRDRRQAEEALPNLVDALHEELEELRRQLADMPPEPAPCDEAADLSDVSEQRTDADNTELAEAVTLGRVSGMLEWLTEDFANGLAGALNGREHPGPDRGRLLRDVRADLRAGLRRLEAALEQPGD
jgi:DivIVA domain-containing protein